MPDQTHAILFITEFATLPFPDTFLFLGLDYLNEGNFPRNFFSSSSIMEHHHCKPNPMRLYYMTTLATAKNYILPERRMRIGKFDRLNDPFELLSVRMNGKHERFVFNTLREYWIKTLGVICMGKHWKSPVMWAHYADNHKGVCLGFDIEDCWPKQIRYEPERMEQLIKVGDAAGGLTEEGLEQVLTTKYQHWAYEEEWRLFLNLTDKDPVNGEYYLDIGPKLILREIIVGARCTAPVGSFRKLVGTVAHSVTVIKARAAFESFTMVRQNRVSAIVINPKFAIQNE